MPELVTDYAVILPPNLDKGIIVYTVVGYTESTLTEFKPFTCKTPLKSYSKLRVNKGDAPITELPRINKDRYNYIYFRAPSTYPIIVDKKGRATPIEEPRSLSSEATFPLWNGGMDGINLFALGGMEHAGSHVVKVRVDPERTYVFFSEYRFAGGPVLSTKIKLSDFINKLKETITPSGINLDPRLNGGWEIVVKTSTIPPKYYVNCVANPEPDSLLDYKPPTNPAQRLYYNIITSKAFNSKIRDFHDEFNEHIRTYKRLDRQLDAALNKAATILTGYSNEADTITETEVEAAIKDGRVSILYYNLFKQLLPNIGDGTAKTTFEGILNPLNPVQKELIETLSRLINEYIDLLDKEESVEKLQYSTKVKTKKAQANIGAAIAAAKTAVREKHMELLEYLKSLGAVKSAASAKGGSRKTRRRRA